MMTIQTHHGRIYSGMLYARVHGTQDGFLRWAMWKHQPSKAMLKKPNPQANMTMDKPSVPSLSPSPLKLSLNSALLTNMPWLILLPYCLVCQMDWRDSFSPYFSWFLYWTIFWQVWAVYLGKNNPTNQPPPSQSSSIMLKCQRCPCHKAFLFG